MSVNEAMLHVTMPDGSVWAVPVGFIAGNRAAYYAHEFGGDLNRSGREDTNPLFESDNYEIIDWAANNMNWDQVESRAVRISDPPGVDYQEGWVNGKKRIVRQKDPTS